MSTTAILFGFSSFFASFLLPSLIEALDRTEKFHSLDPQPRGARPLNNAPDRTQQAVDLLVGGSQV